MYKQFPLKVLGTTFGLLGIIVVFTIMIDPYGLFRYIERVGFNQQKEGVRDKIRYVKSVEVTTKMPKTLIMGSSRVHDGINPESLMIPQEYQPAYNYGIPMIRIKELKFFLLHALQSNANIKTVIIGLDFFMFNAKEKLNIAFDANLLKENKFWDDKYLKACLSTTAFIDSLNTIKASMSQVNRQEFLANGYRPGHHVFYGLKSYEKLHNYTNWIFLSNQQKETLYYQDFALDEEVFSDFQEILELTSRQGIKLFLYISPGHANLDGEGIIASGNLPLFELWKKRLVEITSDFNISLWDFSGYNSITTENVKTPMQYYWDSSHFTEAVGDMILEKVLSSDFLETKAPLDFGIKLTRSNLIEHLGFMRQKREEYLNLYVNEIERLHQMYNSALKGFKQNSEDIEGIF